MVTRRRKQRRLGDRNRFRALSSAVIIALTIALAVLEHHVLPIFDSLLLSLARPASSMLVQNVEKSKVVE